MSLFRHDMEVEVRLYESWRARANTHGPYVSYRRSCCQTQAPQPEVRAVALKCSLLGQAPRHRRTAALSTVAQSTACEARSIARRIGRHHQSIASSKYSRLESRHHIQTTTGTQGHADDITPSPPHSLDHNRFVLKDGASRGRHRFSAQGRHQVQPQWRRLQWWSRSLDLFAPHLHEEEQRRQHARFHPRRRHHHQLWYDMTSIQLRGPARQRLTD